MPRWTNGKTVLVNLSTFNAPRCGNEAFVEWVESQVTSYRRRVEGGASLSAFPNPHQVFQHTAREIWWHRDMLRGCPKHEVFACSMRPPFAKLSASDNEKILGSSICNQEFLQSVHSLVMQRTLFAQVKSGKKVGDNRCASEFREKK
jgi:hypothetical protein